MSHTRRSARRLTAMLAVVGIAAVGALAMPSVARADDVTTRDGRCDQAEGVTVIIDWSDDPNSSGETDLVRCIPLGPGEMYPVEAGPNTVSVVASTGVDYDAPNGVVTSINGYAAEDGRTWHFVTGEVIDGEGVWNGLNAWNPEAEVDLFVGVRLTDSKQAPISIPGFGEGDGEPGDGEGEGEPGEGDGEGDGDGEGEPGDGEGEPGEGEGDGDGEPGEGEPGEGEPGESVPDPPVDPPTAPLPPATPPTTPGTATPGTATPTNSETPSSSQQPSRTPQPTLAAPSTPNPQPPTNRPRPPVDPTPFELPAPPMPELPPIEDRAIEPPEEGTGQATIAPNPTPSIVWGREDATRQSSAATRTQTPAPWSQLAAVAGAMVIVGGLGTAFARGLHTSTPSVVEEE